MSIKKGDTVIVITGKDKGTKGTVLRAIPKDEKVVIEGVNVKKKHQRPNRRAQKGQIVDRPLPVHVSNVMFVDPKTGNRTRIGKKLVDKKYVRVAQKSGTIV